MKKLLALAFAATIAAPVLAQSDEDLYRPEEGQDDMENVAVVAADDPRTPACWPAFVALYEWPETLDMIGIRFTIPFSTKQENVTGLDLGFWGRCKDFEGIQLSLLRNDVKDTFCGFQIGCYNTTGRADLFSLQIGLWNETTSFRGIQAGLVNVTGEGEGLQVGLFNRAESFYGFQVGLINVIRSSDVPMFPLVNIGF